MSGADHQPAVAAADLGGRTPGPAQPGGGRLKQLLSGTGWQAASQVVPLLLNIAFTPHIIRGLGVERWGIMLAINTLTTVLSQLDGGIGQAAMRNFTLYVGQGDKRAVTRLLMNLLGIIALASGAVFVLIWLFSTAVLTGMFNIPQELHAEAVFLLRVLTAIVAVAMVRQLFASLLFSHHIFSLNTMAYLIGHVVYLSGVLLSIRFGWGLYGVGFTFIVQQVLSTVIIVPQALRRMEFRGLRTLSRQEFSEFFGYAWKVQISGVANYLMLAKDLFVIGKLLPAQYVGFYGQGAQFAQQLRMMPFNAISPIQAMIGRAVGEKGTKDSVVDFEAIQRYWVLGVTGFCAVGIPAAFYGVHAWLVTSGAGFAVSGTVAAVLLLGHMFALWGAVKMLWCLTLGHPEVDLQNAVFQLALNLLLTAVMVPLFGPLGSIFATTTSLFIGMLFFIWVSNRVLPFPVRSFLLDVPWAQGVIAGLVSWGLQMLLEGRTPTGGAGLLAHGLLAGPAAVIYMFITIGPRRSIALVKSRLGKS